MCSIRLKHFQYHFRPQCTSVTNRQTHDPSDKPNHYHTRLKSGPANWKRLRRQRSDCRRSDVDARRDWRHRNRSDGFRQFQPHHHLQDLQPPATNITRLDVGVGQFQLSIYTAHNHRTATNGWLEHPACKKISLPVMSRSLPSVLWHCWLGIRKSIRPVKNWMMRCWHGPADATATPLSLASLKSILV